MPTSPSKSQHSGPRHDESRTALFVLGMHRSGTSAVARLLNLRGANLGRDLLPAKADNERGFWENCAVLEVHEAFLAQQGLQWHDLIALPSDWQRSTPARRFVADLPGILDQQFAGEKLSLVKDPRLSLLVPLWIEVLRARNVRPVFVMTIRHPDEVAASLARRDGLPVAQTRLLWLQHLIDAERATRGHARVFVHYGHLLDNWQRELERIGEQLAIDWPPESADFAGAAAEFLAPTLRHHHAGREIDAQMPPIVADAYRQACAAAEGTAAPAMFADLAAPFDALMQCAAPLYRALADRQIVAAGEHAREIEHARAAFAAKETEIEQARANIDALTAELGAAREAHVQRDQLESDLRAAVDERDAQIERAREVFALKEGELDLARVNIDTLTAELSAARDNIDTLTVELCAARDNIDTLTVELCAARDNIQMLTTEIAAARVHIETLAGDLERAREAHEIKDQEISALEDALRSKEREIDAARANIDALAGDIECARQGFAAKDAEIDAARQNIDNLVAEIERARQAHGARDAADAALRRARWYRLGRSLRLIDPHLNDGKSS
jgi:hypothetical protein